MLHTNYNQNNVLTPWDRLQQPMHGNQQQSDTLRLLAALDEGWQIQEAANYLAHGSNAEGLGYLITLYHPKRGQTREISVSNSSELDEILAFENIPGIRH